MQCRPICHHTLIMECSTTNAYLIFFEFSVKPWGAKVSCNVDARLQKGAKQCYDAMKLDCIIKLCGITALLGVFQETNIKIEK